MKATMMTLFTVVVCLNGCIMPPSKVVTLVDHGKPPFIGNLNYDSSYSGVLNMEDGPEGETFTGRFAVVDKTSTQESQRTLIVQQSTTSPLSGTTNSNSFEGIEALGYWYGTGSKGSLLNCVLQVGRGGHGRGSCKHSKGFEYEILM